MADEIRGHEDALEGSRGEVDPLSQDANDHSEEEAQPHTGRDGDSRFAPEAKVKGDPEEEIGPREAIRWTYEDPLL